VHHVCGDLYPPDGFEFFVEGLHGEELHAVEVLVLERADGVAEDTTEKHWVIE
jgi:hypothetical protein